MNERLVRRVTFVIVGPPSAYESLAALTDRSRGTVGRGTRVEEAFLEIRAYGGILSDLDDLVESVLSRTELIADEVRALREEMACSSVLRIVEEVQQGQNPGYGLSAPQVALLAELGAQVDIDLYIDSDVVP